MTEFGDLFYLGKPWSNRALLKRHQNTCTEEDSVEDREKMAVYRPRRKVIEQINVKDTWSSDSQS